MISSDLISIPATSQSLYGKNAGDLASNLFVNEDGEVTGTFHHVTEYTGFSSEPSEQEGYYFPFTLVKSGTNMTFKKNDVATKEDIPWETDNVFRVTSSDTFEVLVDDVSVVKFSFSKAVFES